MKLSEPRIRHLSKKIGTALLSRGAVTTTSTPESVVSSVSKVLLQDRERDEALDEEARGWLAKQRNTPPVGSGEYAAVFSQTKRQFALRKGLNFVS